MANFRIYRKPRKEAASRNADENAQVTTDATTPLVVYFELDGGEPIRAIGQMGEHFTQGLEEVAVAPQSEVELVYLDDDGSGVYERYHAVLFVGDDVRSGSHRVRMWSSEPGEIWVRGFQREVEQPREESRQWKTQAPIGEERATVTRRQ